jgi:hypothetical protein
VDEEILTDSGGNTNDNNEFSCTHSKMNTHTTDSFGILKRLKSRSGGFKQKKSKDVLCFHCGKPADTEPNAKFANEVSKPKRGSTIKALMTQWRKQILH